MKALKRLPIGQSSFERIIKDGKVYVDKTEKIYELINSTEFNFLSRPRRFGKSLLVSTLKNIFLGNKELFKGLWIYNSEWKWEKYPVIVIDFNTITVETPLEVKVGICKIFDNIAKEYGVILKENNFKYKFSEIIIKLYEKLKKQVVVLVDEYDRPIISHLGEGEKRLEIAKKNRDILREFFSTLKSNEVINKLRFLLLTGVSKFSQAGVFSALNNLADLTMNTKYADLLGITEEELDLYLKDHIEECAEEHGISYNEMKEKIRDYYNGYKFSERNIKVYNPYSLMNFLNEKKFRNYWFSSGTPTFLINLIKEKNYYIPEAENLRVEEYVFSTYEIENLDIRALLFQTGYLIIKDYDPEFNEYTLSYPNKELKYSFLNNLFESYVQGTNSRYIGIKRALAKGDIERLIEIIRSIFASIPYIQGSKLNEANFHTLFYLIIGAGGYPAEMEVLTSEGRIDLKVETKDKIYIIEFKCNQSADKAINQIKEKRYFEPFSGKDKDIILMGINFSTETRNIIEYKTETVSCLEFLQNPDKF